MMRFVADENFKGAILRGVLAAKPDADIGRAQDTEISGASDPALLGWEAQEGRIILTHDINTMPGFAYQRVKAGLLMPGVFVVNRNAPIAKIIEDILLLIACSIEGEWANQVSHLPL